MAIKKASTEEGTAEAGMTGIETTGVEIQPTAESVLSADTVAPQPAPEPEAVRSDRAPLKPGVRRVTLAQARAQHAAKHLSQA